MLKKLQNLLFEDEDDDEEEEYEEEEEKKPAHKPVRHEEPVSAKPAPAPAPAVKPSVQRIDVTQPLPTVNAKTEQPAAPAAKPAAPAAKPAAKPAAPAAEARPSTLGITADKTDADLRREKKAEAKKPVKKAEPHKEEKKNEEQGYVFKPVISPIFGVDEKDVTALKNTTKKLTDREKAKDRADANISPIISPMYGPDASSNGARSSEDAVNDIADQIVANDETQENDDLPDFSLDDILNSSDEKKPEAEEAVNEVVDQTPDFPDLADLEEEPVPGFDEKTAELPKIDAAPEADAKPVPTADKPADMPLAEKPVEADDNEPLFPDLDFDDEDSDAATRIIEKPNLFGDGNE